MIIYLLTLFAQAILLIYRIRAYQFGRLPSPYFRSSKAFSSTICFELLNSLSRIIGVFSLSLIGIGR